MPNLRKLYEGLAWKKKSMLQPHAMEKDSMEKSKNIYSKKEKINLLSSSTLQQYYDVFYPIPQDPRYPSGDGLPFLCENCGRSFYRLSYGEKEDFCSGECRWSAVLSAQCSIRAHDLTYEYGTTARSMDRYSSTLSESSSRESIGSRQEE